MHSQHRGMVDMGSHTFSYLLGCVSLVVPGILSHEGKAWRMVWVSRLIERNIWNSETKAMTASRNCALL